MPNKKQTKLYSYLHTVNNKQFKKIMYRTQNVYTFVYLGELLLIVAIGAFTMLHASNDNTYKHLYRYSSSEISNALNNAITQGKPKNNQSKVISVWTENRTHIENTFFPGYCTRGAALISPEFFPFKDEATQQRTRGGNAVDRCEGAKDAGYKIGNKAIEGSLIVYKGLASNGYFGHVAKVIYTNKSDLIVRDMNRLSKYTRTDRREDSNNNNIKCFIYPQKNNSDSPSSNNSNNTIDNNKTESNDNSQTNNNTQNQHNAADKPSNEKEEKPVEKDNSQKPEQNETTNNNTEEVKEEKVEEKNNTEKDKTNNESDNSNNKQESTKEPENNNFYQTNKSDLIEFIIKEDIEFSELTKHFLSQNEIKIQANNNGKIKLGDEIKINIEIINKQNKEKFIGVLPFTINIITSNSNLSTNLSTIQLIHQHENIVKIQSKEKGKSSIVLSIDNKTIKNIFIDID